MFKEDNNIIELMDHNLKNNYNKKDTDNLIKIKEAIDKVSDACKIFDKYGLHSTSNILLDLLANLK